jgi:hypothetical protein
VKAYQTVFWLTPTHALGSPGSELATLSTGRSENGREPIAVASAKSSLAGAVTALISRCSRLSPQKNVLPCT